MNGEKEEAKSQKCCQYISHVFDVSSCTLSLSRCVCVCPIWGVVQSIEWTSMSASSCAGDVEWQNDVEGRKAERKTEVLSNNQPIRFGYDGENLLSKRMIRTELNGETLASNNYVYILE